MDETAFKEAAPGRLVHVPEGVSAFIPDPLPPQLDVGDLRLLRTYGQASEALGKLNAAITPAEISPYLIARPLLTREAFFSTRMEGTYTTPKEMALFEVRKKESSPDAAEAMNYVDAMERALQMIREEGLPICHRLIRGAHETLLAGVRGAEMHPGRYRNGQNFVGRRAAGIKGARYVPPPVDAMNAAMDDLERYINRDREGGYPLLMDLALVHYQFEAIHPFFDGNGRIGRLLVPLMLCSQNRIGEPLLYVSAYFDRNKEEYTDRLLAVSTDGDWTGWVVFFLEALKVSAEESLAKALGLKEMRHRYRENIRVRRASQLLSTLVDSLFQRPVLTFNLAKDLLGVSHAQAARHVRRLEQLDIVTEITGGQRNLQFLAEEILNFVYE